MSPNNATFSLTIKEAISCSVFLFSITYTRLDFGSTELDTELDSSRPQSAWVPITQLPIEFETNRFAGAELQSKVA